MNLQHVVTRRFAPVEQSYDWRDCALYAVSLGISSDPLDERELPYVYEGRAQQVMPSWCATLAWPPFWQADPATGIHWQRILHGELHFHLHRPLPLQTTVRATHRVAGVQDKGVHHGALVHFDTELRSAASHRPLATLRSVHFLRGDGGCGDWGERRAGLPPLDPAARPDAWIDVPTAGQAALLYRLASRDLMPLHADPEVARAAGFDRPITHGLNMMGIACRALLRQFLPGHPDRMTTMAVRFTQPGLPGDTLRVEMFESPEGARFRVRALERDLIVLDRGSATFSGD